MDGEEAILGERESMGGKISLNCIELHWRTRNLGESWRGERGDQSHILRMGKEIA